ncbi:quinoprotein dehydrogenase-associated SoxYZ-like carrier [Rhodocyclus tenuis]|uniref:Sulfur-oxidizing protein SoxY n=1 Tax=Rhodocyclus tenuis TaxID=1066 RepID=A0A840G3T8_RHOTE|nr:quinoprotein dehydrogenase-associated SoxYZ-like carrier [Rhodocyclus tenuis]MBB4245680.1 sulfur-oxidizing protein SoxY [Rhodocyclus tenuis]
MSVPARLAMSLLVALGASGTLPASAFAAAADPLASARWEEMRRGVLGGTAAVFDAQVKVLAPANAENPTQVPVTVDATALADVAEVVVFADFNPIVEVLRFYPESAAALLGFRVKLQQSTPLRAAARGADGVWHVGGSWVNTVGGGCTAPSAAAASTAWQSRLNEVSGRQWQLGAERVRLRLRVVHPMDTGLVAGTPSFHLDDVELRGASGERLMRLRLFEPVAENPVFTIEYRAPGQTLVCTGGDNNGNRFSARIAP